VLMLNVYYYDVPSTNQNPLLYGFHINQSSLQQVS
jgi:hypothetical protein